MSNSLNEWDLLVVSEDIEPGDYVWVESDDGDDPVKMMFVKNSSKTVTLRDEEGEIYKFSTNTLEEVSGNRYITSKAD